MNVGKIIWGLILVFVGMVLLLENLGMISFSWHVLWKFWPVFFILMGVNMAFGKSKSLLSAAITVLIVILTLVFIVYQASHSRERGYLNFRFNDWDDDTVATDLFSGGKLSEPYAATTKKAVLRISGAATNYTLTDTTSNLFDADIKQHDGSYALEKKHHDSVDILDFRMRGGNNKSDVEGKRSNKVNLYLNVKPIWNIETTVGAGETNFDLSPFKIDTLTLKGDATRCNVKLGLLASSSTILIEEGIAKAAIKVPQNSACRLYVTGGLLKQNPSEFTKQPDGTYTSNGYSANKNRRINIYLKGDLAKFDIKRY
mgnify:CR=1 FL=1